MQTSCSYEISKEMHLVSAPPKLTKENLTASKPKLCAPQTNLSIGHHLQLLPEAYSILALAAQVTLERNTDEPE